MKREAARIAFLEHRDGVEGAKAFARNTLAAYRKAARLTPDGKKQFPHDRTYRASFVESILDLRRYLKEQA